LLFGFVDRFYADGWTRIARVALLGWLSLERLWWPSTWPAVALVFATSPLRYHSDSCLVTPWQRSFDG
jgi:hypothetical protein